MPERFLLVQPADIGDLIVTTPAITALREAHPDAHITLLTTEHAAPIIEPGAVDEVLTFKRFTGVRALLDPRNWQRLWALRRRHFTTMILFRHLTYRVGTLKYALIARASGVKRCIGLDNGNGWFLTAKVPDLGFGAKHEAQYWLDLANIAGADNAPRRAEVAFDEGVLPLPAHRGLRIIMHAGSGGYSKARRWAPHSFAQAADKLHDDLGAQIVLVGTANDDATKVITNMRHTPVDLTGRTSLTQLADLIRSADLFIGADSGVMHLAAAVRTPVIAIFGPSNHEAWGPWSPGGRTLILRSAPECSPCSYVQHRIGARDGCKARTCMRLVTVEQVAEAATAVLQDETYFPSQPWLDDELRWHDRIQILGLPVDRITYAQWMDLINQWVWQGTRAHHVCTVNPEFMMIAQNDPVFHTVLNRADLCIPDGIGLLYAARYLKEPLPERVTGSDGIYWIAEHAAKNNWKLFLLGAKPGVAQDAAKILEKENFGLMVVGTYAGSPRPEEEDAIVERVNASGAHILLVAYGAPEQDKWIARNMQRLNVKMAMGIGGSLDFVAGVVPRAPEWMQRYNIEWLFRLYKQPQRIFRMLRLPRFVVSVLVRGEN